MTGKTKDQLLEEISQLRGRVEELQSELILHKSHEESERKSAAEALKTSEDKYRLITEYARDVIWIFDLNLNHVYLSPSVKSLRGYTVDEAMKQRFDEILSPDSYRESVKNFYEELQLELTGRKHPPDYFRVIEFEMTHKNSTYIWVESTMSYLRDAEGNAVGVMGITRDITERKRAEENLRQSEAKFRFLAENMNDIVWTTDLHYDITYESPSVYKILGYTPEERQGNAAMMLLTQNSRKEAAEALAEFLEQEREKGYDPYRSVKMELEYIHKNGSLIWMESVASAIRDQNGKMTGFYGVSRDITERKRSEAALQSSQAKYRLLADSMNDIIWITDESFTITYVTPSVVRVLGYTPEERIGQSPTTVLIPEAQKKAFEAFFQFLEQERTPGNDPNRTVKMELQYVKKDGSIIWMESVTSAIRDQTGRLIGFHGAVRDVTKRRLAEDELARHREELESLVQKRTKELSAANKRLKQENERRKRTEGSLRHRESQLKKKRQELEEINSTLKILLKQREEDKTSMENNIISNIKISLLPFLEKLEESDLEKNQELIVKQLRSQIKEITSPFIKKISSELLGLTTSEIQVASLIKAGKSSHEIAGIMNVSLNTIITHRYNIRRKTGLKNNKINLCSYLQSLE